MAASAVRFANFVSRVAGAATALRTSWLGLAGAFASNRLAPFVQHVVVGGVGLSIQFPNRKPSCGFGKRGCGVAVWQ